MGADSAIKAACSSYFANKRRVQCFSRVKQLSLRDEVGGSDPATVSACADTNDLISSALITVRILSGYSHSAAHGLLYIYTSKFQAKTIVCFCCSSTEWPIPSEETSTRKQNFEHRCILRLWTFSRLEQGKDLPCSSI